MCEIACEVRAKVVQAGELTPKVVKIKEFVRPNAQTPVVAGAFLYL
jgi:hypothetical protein